MRMLDRLKVLFKDRQSGIPGEHHERRRIPRASAKAGLRVLVVDDSITVLAVLGKMLRQDSYQVLEARDGQQALEQAKRERPELILLDIVMPGMSGFAVLRALRREPTTQDIPVIMISGNLRATEQFYGQRIGADDFIRKPFGRRDVFLRIQHLVEIGRLPARDGDDESLVDELELDSDELVGDEPEENNPQPH